MSFVELREFVRSATLGLLLAVFSCLSNISGQDRAQAENLILTPCHVDGFTGNARCGNYAVYENRETMRGRRIALKVVVVPAASPERAPDPTFFIAGGPGSSAIASAAGVIAALSQIHQHRDLVFVDQRGTGGSHPLNCDLYNQSDLKSYFGDVFPASDVSKCRDQLTRDADLTLYSTSLAVDDLDEVRAALGYERINLFAGSYGTRVALVFLKRHEAHVRTLTLQGVSPPNEFVPRHFAANSERALQGILGECKADPTCNQTFPNLRVETRAVFERLAIGAVDASLSSSHLDVKLSRAQAAEGIRFMLYSPSMAGRVPLMLHLASQGEFAPIAQATLAYRRQVLPSASIGLYLSITCAEDVPWIKRNEGERLARNTFLGDSNLRQLRAACDQWPQARIPSDYGTPTQSTVPVLILTGEWDPVTPPENGTAVSRFLPNSLNLVVPHGGHDFGGLDGVQCITRLITDFVERGQSKEIDTSCLRNVKRVGFVFERQASP